MGKLYELDEAHAAKLDAAARAQGVPEQELLARAVDAYVKTNGHAPPAPTSRTIGQILKEAGVWEPLEDGDPLPADLSTNPKYMEGFGRD